MKNLFDDLISEDSKTLYEQGKFEFLKKKIFLLQVQQGYLAYIF